MQHAKETVRSLLDQLPDNCSLDDVLYHLYVIQAVEQGRADVKAGRLIPHDEVARELRRSWRVDASTSPCQRPRKPVSTKTSARV